MARKSPVNNPEQEGGGSGRLARRVLGIAGTLAMVAGIVWGVRYLGELARSGIAPRDRYTVRFGDIQCDAPPDYQRIIFLSEVRFHSKFPQTFQSIDPEMTPKLTAAFAAHPWVAAVEEVAVEPENAVRVKLRFRVPALAVRIAGTEADVRVVDAEGVLLPLGAKADGLPQLNTPVLAPLTPSGKPWANETVKRAVELVAAHHPRTVEQTPKGWRLTMEDGKVVMVEK